MQNFLAQGATPQNPQTAPYFEFLATRLNLIIKFLK